ncbi:TPA: type 1 fimbrial protein [Escherichia coli]|nr:type 1 fimbrial protein [Escherichia coli]EGK3476277.1 type 1 fimbrial protein [Escherichia coli]EIP7100589.1 type 1 fimbrial protein [Escherichia coli]EIS6311244.1 type 1 fimbrial protein [Escherichia coli]EJD4208479.1 type 1 fimbrial protein [Escherichia coli]
MMTSFFHTRCVYIISCVLFYLIANSSYAAMTCKNSTGESNDTVTLAGSITVGNDLPNGSVVYSQEFYPSKNVEIRCSSEFNLDLLSTLPGAPAQIGKDSDGAPLYETSVPGIAVKFLNNRQPIPARRVGVFFGNADQWISLRTRITVQLIKVGNVTSGMVNAGSFPVVHDVVPLTSGVNGTPLQIRTLQFLGSINVTTGTCTTPSFSINLGKHKQSEFTAKGMTTDWVDSSITLTNCPVFYGYWKNWTGVTGKIFAGSGTLSPVQQDTHNIFEISFQPVGKILIPSEGVFSLIEDTQQADGVGIQLASGYKNPIPVNFNRSYSYNLYQSSGKTIRILFSARLYQTKDNVTPGDITGKIIYTVSYK